MRKLRYTVSMILLIALLCAAAVQAPAEKAALPPDPEKSPVWIVDGIVKVYDPGTDAWKEDGELTETLLLAGGEAGLRSWFSEGIGRYLPAPLTAAGEDMQADVIIYDNSEADICIPDAGPEDFRTYVRLLRLYGYTAETFNEEYTEATERNGITVLASYIPRSSLIEVYVLAPELLAAPEETAATAGGTETAAPAGRAGPAATAAPAAITEAPAVRPEATATPQPTPTKEPEPLVRDWFTAGIGMHLPKPVMQSGEEPRLDGNMLNSDEMFYARVAGAKHEDFENYIRLMIRYGYTIDEQGDAVFTAHDETGYRVTVTYYPEEEKMEVSVLTAGS